MRRLCLPLSSTLGITYEGIPDSNIIQHAATTYQTYDIQFGGAKRGEPLVRKGPVATVVKQPAKHANLRNQIDRLPELAAMLKRLGVSLVTSRENFSEVKKAPRSRSEYFYGGEISFAEPPPEPYHFVSLPSGMNPGPTDNQFHNFLHGLKHPRFLEFAKYAGAINPAGFNYQQMADAYFLWCAEVNQVDYFLTLDGNLQRAIGNSPKLKFKSQVVNVTELIDILSEA